MAIVLVGLVVERVGPFDILVWSGLLAEIDVFSVVWLVRSARELTDPDPDAVPAVPGDTGWSSSLYGSTPMPPKGLQ